MGRIRLTITATLFTAAAALGCGFSSCRNGRPDKQPGRPDSLATTIDPEELPEPQAPAGYSLLARALGDLDADGTEDLAVAWSGPAQAERGESRRLILYKAAPSGWTIWHESSGPLLGSEEDGQSGDPFHTLGIENGAVVINHIGGSRSRWDYLHRYRYNKGNWELISAAIAYGELCDTFTTIEYNLLTGAVDANRESNNCDETGTEVPGKGDARLQQFVRRQASVPMDGFRPGKNELETPDNVKIFY